jgi:two-component system aerobic respiration control sensor histidine kinase ArcB
VGDTGKASQVNAKAWASCKQVMETKCQVVLEEKHQDRWYLSVKAPLLHEDRVIGVMGISIDITDRKKLEYDLRESQKKTATAYQSKIKFISAASHETRGPVGNSISMMDILSESLDKLKKQLLNDEKSAPLLAEMTESLSSAKEEAWRALNCLKNLGDLHRLQQTTLKNMREKASVETEIGYGISLAKEMRPRRSDVEIFVETDPAIPDEIMLDRLNIREALRIIIGNAIRFSNKKGTVTLRATLNSSLLYITVEDNGPGISKNALETLFKNIVEEDPSEKSNYYKPSLQLPQAKIYIEASGGQLEIQSIQNKGTTVTLSTPYELLDSAQNKQKQDIAIQLNTYFREQYILYVEDDPIAQQIVKKYVTELGHRIDIASTGEEGLRLALLNHYDLFFLDITLPDMTGVDLMPHLIAHYGTKTIAIALTSHASEYNEEFFEEHGIPVTLAKPINREQLAKAIQDAIEIKQYMDQVD